ncbi:MULTISPECIES: TonB-dependent siderophore receptor [Halomonadaceae]|uniref:Fe(3+)-pyochelin receptor n=1 Tax=Vreelandella titanicae TaxID=664683 RepID=A0AAP9NSD1_9GAMM|nr:MULTISPECIES: TonB-dependent receptor [Halomonas]QKS27422.1 Fe(3+)-pyochelin receptor [Halomonas titanicae]CDG53392.1 Ferric-pseudobactin BN7/BN8 receptor [Halomonas sp. A3H3]SDI86834.1 outer-membrane receptor for ferric coprogen and ferric-rhodotorulic acid [Halomonas titanicae]
MLHQRTALQPLTAKHQPTLNRRALALAVHLAAAGLLAVPLLSQPAMAQSTQQQARHYDIASGPVSSVINRFAAEAGVFISGAGELGEGRQSPGLQGQYRVDEGLERLLNGTSLRAVKQGDGTYRLEERPDGVALSTVEVTGARLPYGMTENSNSYTSESATIGLFSQSVKETPQSVSVVTRERLDDQGTTSLAEAMRNVTGVTVNEYGGNQYTIKARGYNIDSFLIDGSPVQDVGSAWESAGVFDTALLDRIEVLRGPAGILHGSGEPSGTINLVRKRALAESQASVSLSAGTNNAYRGAVDVTGSLDNKGRVRGRFVGVYDDRDSFIDHVYSDNQIGYGTLEFDLSPETTLSMGVTVQDEEFRPHSGLPAYSDGTLPNVDRSTYLGSDWDKQTGDAQRYFIELEHRLANGGEITFKANRLNRDANLRKSSEGVLTADKGTGDFGIRQIAWGLEKQDDYIETQVSSPFQLAGASHEAVFGASYQNSEVSNEWVYGAPQYLPQNLYDPIHNRTEPDFDGTPGRTELNIEQHASYGQLRFNILDDFTLALGGRINWWETNNFLGGETSGDDGTEFIPYAGLIYRLNEELNLYTSYTGIFAPQTAVGTDGDPIKPREGEQYEAGIKGSHSEGNLNWHAAVFRIEDTNRAYTDPNNPGFSIPIGEAKSEGFELEVSGQLLPRWDISAGYAYTQTEFVRDASSEGLTLSPDTPEHNFNLWSRYRFSDAPDQGWRIGAGVNTVSSIYAESGDTRFEQGGYTTVSAMLGYRVNENLDVSLNGNNLTDKEYYSTVRGTTKHNYYGAPRNFIMTVEYDF